MHCFFFPLPFHGMLTGMLISHASPRSSCCKNQWLSQRRSQKHQEHRVAQGVSNNEEFRAPASSAMFSAYLQTIRHKPFSSLTQRLEVFAFQAEKPTNMPGSIFCGRITVLLDVLFCVGVLLFFYLCVPHHTVQSLALFFILILSLRTQLSPNSGR